MRRREADHPRSFVVCVCVHPVETMDKPTFWVSLVLVQPERKTNKWARYCNGLSRAPFLLALQHNRGTATGPEHSECRTRPATETSAWRPAMIVGPFPTPAAAQAYSLAYGPGSGSMDKRCARALELATGHGVPCYTLRAPPPPQVLGGTGELAALYAEMLERCTEEDPQS